jgi:hypothetical protein
MKTRSLFVLATIVVLVGGCGVTHDLVPVTYEGEAVTQSDLAAVVYLNTGQVAGHSASPYVFEDGVYVPKSKGYFPFDAEDQATFVESLKSELRRLGIVGSIVDAPADDTAKIVVDFVRTKHYGASEIHDHYNHHKYELKVGMLMAYRDREAIRDYEIVSSEGDSYREKWNTSPSEGKEKAAAKLLNLAINDIQQFIAGYGYDSDVQAAVEASSDYTEEERLAIEKGEIFVGMSEQALQESWGYPTFSGSFLGSGLFKHVCDPCGLVASKKGPWGVRSIYRYGDHTSDLKQMVFVENQMVVNYGDSWVTDSTDLYTDDAEWSCSWWEWPTCNKTRFDFSLLKPPPQVSYRQEMFAR